MKKLFLPTVAAACLLMAAATAEASHFRGGAIVPTVDASGNVTVTATSFWRPSGLDDFSPISVSGGVGSVSRDSIITDASDSRFTKRTEIFTFTLPAAGTYTISYASCCRVSGINNASASSFGMESVLVWDGSTANAPILFDFSAIQPEVIRGAAYSDNLGATAGNGGTLSYDQTLNTSIISQPPGFSVNTTTGELSILAASTASYTDNPSNAGADYAFSGHILNSDGSSVEFDWLFDAVDTAGNLAPDVTNHTINAVIGDLISQIVTGTDPNALDDVTLSFLSSFGTFANAFSFVPGAPGNPTTGLFSWDSSGSAAGTYIVNIRGTDGLLTDSGTITINLRAPVAAAVPLPPAGLLGLGLLGGLGFAGAVRRRRRRIS